MTMLFPFIDIAVLKIYLATIENMYTFLFCIITGLLLIVYWKKFHQIAHCLGEFIHGVQGLHHSDHQTLWAIQDSLVLLRKNTGLQQSVMLLRKRIRWFVVGAVLFFGAHFFTSLLFAIGHMGAETRPLTMEQDTMLGFNEISKFKDDRNIQAPEVLSEKKLGSLNLLLGLTAVYTLLLIKIGAFFITFSFGSNFFITMGKRIISITFILLFVGLFYWLYSEMLGRLYENS